MVMGNLLERPDQAIFPDRRTDRAAVYELVRSLSLLVDPDALLEKVGEGLRRLFRADLVLVLLREVEQGDFTPCYSLGYDSRALAGVGMSRRGRLARWFGEDTHCLDLADRLELQKHLDPAEQELLARLKVQLCIPLVSLGRLIGVILLGSRDPAWHLAREGRELLEMLAAQAALALENAVLHSRQSDRLRRLYRAERLATAGRLAASVAHEIRNPLTVISSTVQYILQGFAAGDPRQELAEGVLAEVARMERTMDSLLRLGRTREVLRGEHDLRESLDRSLLLIEVQARQRGIEVERRFDGETQPGHEGGLPGHGEGGARDLALDTQAKLLVFAAERVPRFIPGFGAGFSPSLCRMDLVRVALCACLGYHCDCRSQLRWEGCSSGSVRAAVARLRDVIPPGAQCVMILTNCGERYLNTVYSDDWVCEHLGLASCLELDQVPGRSFMKLAPAS